MSFRYAIRDFQLASPLYTGALVSFWTVDDDGVKTSTPATLYASPTGSTTLSNPQTLDGEGKFSAPVYTNAPVIAEVVGRNVGSHSTGVIGTRGIWRGNWVTATVYYATDLVKDGSDAKVYNVADDYTASATVAADVLAGHLVLVFDPTALAYPGASQGDLFYGSATNVISPLSKSTTATRYLSNTGTSNNPAWAQVNLTNGVTGILPGANGGTGVANTGLVLSLTGNLLTSGGHAINLSAIADSSVTLPVSGTLATQAGAETLTNKTMSGAANTFSNIGGTSIRMGSDAQGDITYFNGTNYVRLGAGTTGSSLKTFGASANPAWVLNGFYAHKNSSNQTGLADSVYTKLTFGTEKFDLGGCFNTTNSRWTPPAGLVQLNAFVFIASGAKASGSSFYVAKIIKNGVTDVAAGPGAANPGTPTTASTNVSAVDQANGTDYYEVFLFVITDTTVTVDGNLAHTHFSGHVV